MSASPPPAIRVGIVIFEDVEVLDVAGPYEVFSVVDRHAVPRPLELCLVAQERGAVIARNRFHMHAHESFRSCPPLDWLLVPGSGGYRSDGTPYGTRAQRHNAVLLDWLRERAAGAQYVLSVCSGALILAAAGLLDGRSATTHRGACRELRATGRDIHVLEDVRVVDSGTVLTSAGISAGIDLALLMLAKTFGEAKAAETAAYLEYEPPPARAPARAPDRPALRK
jgi:transcriptional regulator GlxA family with amidase domain